VIWGCQLTQFKLDWCVSEYLSYSSCAAISPVVIAQSLTRTLENGQLACRGSRISFTCVTRESGGIAWTSDTYVGPNNFQLRFDDFNSQGSVRTSASNVDTVARLTSNREDQGVRVLESTLSIVLLSDPQTASVTCIHTASGQRNVTNFQVIGTLFNVA
jgi:hypothetical protein